MDCLVRVDFELHEEIGEECNATQSASLMLYPGMDTGELQSMLAAIFGIFSPSSIAAIQVPPDGYIIPLSYISMKPGSFAVGGDKAGAALHVMVTRPIRSAPYKQAPDLAPINGDTALEPINTARLTTPITRVVGRPARDTGPLAGDNKATLLELVTKLGDPPVPLMNPAEQIAIRARVESDDREILQGFDAYRRGDDMIQFFRLLLSLAQTDLSSVPTPSLELTLARIWILKEMSLITQQECLTLQDLARDQDSLIASVFIIYGGNDVDEETLAKKLLEATKASNYIETDEERDRKRLIRFRLQIVKDLFDAELLDSCEVSGVTDGIIEMHPLIEQAFSEFAMTGDSGRLAQRVTGDLTQLVEGDGDDSINWLLARLSDTHGLSDHWTRALRQLIRDGDEMVMAAIDAFNKDCDWVELIETIDALLAQRASEKRALTPTRYDDDLAGKTQMLTVKERRHLCQLTDDLCKESLIDDSHWASLKALVLRKDPVIEAAYSLYSAHNDWSEFADTSLRLACRSHPAPSHVAAGLELEATLNQLVLSGRVGPSAADRIMTAAQDVDDSVMAIIDQYEADENIQDLKDNLVQLSKCI